MRSIGANGQLSTKLTCKVFHILMSEMIGNSLMEPCSCLHIINVLREHWAWPSTCRHFGYWCTYFVSPPRLSTALALLLGHLPWVLGSNFSLSITNKLLYYCLDEIVFFHLMHGLMEVHSSPIRLVWIRYSIIHLFFPQVILFHNKGIEVILF